MNPLIMAGVLNANEMADLMDIWQGMTGMQENHSNPYQQDVPDRHLCEVRCF